MSTILVVLAWSFALTNLKASDPTVEPGAKSAASLTRSDRSEHPLPEGEGWSAPQHYSSDAVGLDSWRANFSKQLDESLARLQTDDGKQRSGVVEITRGRGVASQLPFVVTTVSTENDATDAMIARLLQQHGLPRGLTSVVAVESAFNPVALSPKGARGLWQLMPATARRYGLTVAPHLDERTDPVRSTRAAAAYMKDLFAQFQDWPLALAAYNAGEDRVTRAMTRTGARDFWTLRRRAALPEETLHYVPAVLEKFEGQLFAPQKDVSNPATVGDKNVSAGGRIAYALPAAD